MPGPAPLAGPTAMPRLPLSVKVAEAEIAPPAQDDASRGNAGRGLAQRRRSAGRGAVGSHRQYAAVDHRRGSRVAVARVPQHRIAATITRRTVGPLSASKAATVSVPALPPSR